jgi:hypothetical protein
METDRRPSIACRVYPCHDLQHGRRPLHFKSNLCTPAIVTNLPNRRLRCELRRAVRPGGRLWATQHEPRGTPFQFTIPRLQADRDHVDVSVSRRLEREAERNVEVIWLTVKATTSRGFMLRFINNGVGALIYSRVGSR